MALALLSFSILAYQITQVRIFAYALNPVLVYSAISITMLGFGAASTALTLSSRLREAPLLPLLAGASLAFAISGVVANVAFARLSPTITLKPDLLGSATASELLVIALSTLPYAFGGLAVALVLSRRTARAGRFYFFNLLGSGVGCAVVTFVLTPLGAEGLVLALMAIAATTAGLLATGPRLRAASYLTAIALTAAIPWAPRLLPYRPDSTDQHAVAAEAYREAGVGEPRRDFAAWDPVARIEIHSWPGQVAHFPHPVPFKFLTQDGGAGTLLLAVGEDPAGGGHMFRGALTGLPFQLRPKPRVLVIGVGGTGDVQAAHHFGAEHVTAVEINASTVRAMTTTFADFLDRSLLKPNVDVVVADGRSFVRRTDERFDVISIPGVDTLTLQSSGSFVFAEEYLYTEEAFADYLRALADDGVLAVLRFAREPVRLSMMGAHALRQMGVARPDEHIVVLEQGSLNLTLVKRRPWTAEELTELDGIVAGSTAELQGVSLKVMSTFFHILPMRYLYAPHQRHNDTIFTALMDSIARGRFPDIELPTDDRPYYFSSEWVNYFRGKAQPGPVKDVLDGYVKFMGLVITLSLLAILLPVFVLRRRGARTKRVAGTVAYFSALGFCFMFLEIGLIQKTAIVVEHPAYSIAVVLASLLISSGLGSLASQRLGWSLRRNVLAAVAGIVVLGVCYAFGLDALLRTVLALSFGLRMVVVAMVIAPLGVAMGMLLPSGLRALGDGGKGLAAWAIAANGLASVIGSVASLPFAVMFGFTALLLAGVGLYLVAALAFPLMDSDPA